MLMVNMIIVFGLVMNLVKFIFNNMYLLISLLSLEYISILMYWYMSMNLVYMGLEMYYLLYFLVMMTCEGVLGLSLLIVCSFSHSINFMKWYNSSSC
uniref:NADH dehydrogenase subunit 4L n=1 Tax=Metacrangonyx spinicaudatus TaxID=1199190 RepID=K7ZVS0_9CRUS|nr:NADH dehydrogenase subunit 4L [Metacrangonyx spinicaudatus]CCI69429.1 NADH dehydrogenase subunit 4L [Metacrangonyx spinicaudatus]